MNKTSFRTEQGYAFEFENEGSMYIALGPSTNFNKATTLETSPGNELATLNELKDLAASQPNCPKVRKPKKARLAQREGA